MAGSWLDGAAAANSLHNSIEFARLTQVVIKLTATVVFAWYSEWIAAEFCLMLHRQD